MTESEAREQFLTKPLACYLTREYDFSSADDTVEAMKMGKELFEAGRLQGLEEAAKIAEKKISEWVHVFGRYESEQAVLKHVAAAIRERK